MTDTGTEKKIRILRNGVKPSVERDFAPFWIIEINPDSRIIRSETIVILLTEIPPYKGSKNTGCPFQYFEYVKIFSNGQELHRFPRWSVL
jgi:hypothetical protein